MERGDMADSSSDNNNAVPSEKRSSEDQLGRQLGNFSKRKLGKIVGGGRGKKEVSNKAM
jgi:hypothetical protein